jgi:hypothetical protein
MIRPGSLEFMVEENGSAASKDQLAFRKNCDKTRFQMRSPQDKYSHHGCKLSCT